MVATAKEKVRPYYPDDPSSIPRIAQVWLHKPVSPLVVPDVFARRRNFVNSDLHVLLVDADKGERFQQKLQLEGLGYQVSSAPSGAAAKELLGEHGGEFHIVMVDDQLMAEGPDCEALVYWASTAAPHLKEVNFLVSAYEMPAERAARLVRLGATGVLLKPISSDTVIQMRVAAGQSQNLQQQRALLRQEGGAKLATRYLVRREMGDAIHSEVVNIDAGVTSVLVVHREAEAVAGLRHTLKSCGYKVHVARSGREAFRLLREASPPFSLMLLDFDADEAGAIQV